MDRFAGHVTEHRGDAWAKAWKRAAKRYREWQLESIAMLINARAWARRMKRERDEARADTWAMQLENERLIRELNRHLENIARLRGLIKSVEWTNYQLCPWCSVWGKVHQYHHSPTCPAFNTDGTMR